MSERLLDTLLRCHSPWTIQLWTNTSWQVDLTCGVSDLRGFCPSLDGSLRGLQEHLLRGPLYGGALQDQGGAGDRFGGPGLDGFCFTRAPINHLHPKGSHPFPKKRTVSPSLPFSTARGPFLCDQGLGVRSLGVFPRDHREALIWACELVWHSCSPVGTAR